MPEKVSLEPESLDVMESRSADEWRKTTRTWEAQTIVFAKILINADPEQRTTIATGITEIEFDEKSAALGSYFAHLASLSDRALKNLKSALDLK